jgi:hypothetical protein
VKTDENGTLQWQKTYGGSGVEEPNGLCQTADGGYIMVGHTTSYGAGLFDMWLVKTDSSGNMQWSKTYGGTGDDWGSNIILTPDGGYAITGQTYSTSTGFDGWLVKTDQAGDVQWILTLGGVDTEATYSVILTADGNYLVTGATGSFGAGILDGWLLEIHVGSGLSWVASTANSITLYRETSDQYWNYVRVRIWKPKTP